MGFESSNIAKKFKSTLIKNNISTVLFDNNVSSLKLYKVSYLKKCYSAMYLLKRNEMYFLDHEYVDQIWHELLHMSSTYIDGDIIRSGFSVITPNSEFGIALNEGMTAYLDKKLFFGITPNHDELISSSYAMLSYLVELLITSFEDFAIECYFNADAESLIEVLIKYQGRKKTEHFINSLDNILKYYGLKNRYILKQSLKSYNYALCYIFEFYKKGLIKSYKEGMISLDQYKDTINTLYNTLSTDIIINNKVYSVDTKTLKKILS